MQTHTHTRNATHSTRAHRNPHKHRLLWLTNTTTMTDYTTWFGTHTNMQSERRSVACGRCCCCCLLVVFSCLVRSCVRMCISAMHEITVAVSSCTHTHSATSTSTLNVETTEIRPLSLSLRVAVLYGESEWHTHQLPNSIAHRTRLSSLALSF